MPELGIVEIVVLLAFVTWCVAVFFFLRRMSARGKKSAAEGDPARRGMDELIRRVEESYPRHDSESPENGDARSDPHSMGRSDAEN